MGLNIIRKFAHGILLMKNIQNIVVIGAGNVGSHLARSLMSAGCNIVQVAGRHEANVIALAQEVGAPAHTLDFSEVGKGHDLYILALPDQAMAEVLPRLGLHDELIVHTSGSAPMEVLSPYSLNTGVIYPLQTFTGSRNIDLKEVPVLIEANSKSNEAALSSLAKKLSSRVSTIDSRQRQILHLAAVFACNFSNHMYDIAEQILAEHGLDFDLLKPLILETAGKAVALGPRASQTGPARRKDMRIIREHLELLKDHEAARELYMKISHNIIDQSENNG